MGKGGGNDCGVFTASQSVPDCAIGRFLFIRRNMWSTAIAPYRVDNIMPIRIALYFSVQGVWRKV